MPIFFGAMASLLIGISDYFGRYVTRRSAAVTTVITALVAGVVVSLVLVVIVPSTFTARDFGLGAGSGALVGMALSLMYAGMARSSTAVVSPVVGLGGVLVPLVFDLAGGTSPERLQVVGFGLAITSLVLTTFSPQLGDRVWTGLAYGSGAGLAFGVALTMIGRTNIESGMWAAVGQRLVGALFLVAVAVISSRPVVLPAALRFRAVIGGVAGMCGIGFFIAGAQRGSLAVVAVAGSMFPAVTAILAAVFDKDVLRWWQVVGIVGVLTGVGLIAAA